MEAKPPRALRPTTIRMQQEQSKAIECIYKQKAQLDAYRYIRNSYAVANVRHIHTRPEWDKTIYFILYESRGSARHRHVAHSQLHEHSGHTSKTFSTFARPLLSLLCRKATERQ